MQVARNSAGVSWLIGFRRQSGHPDTKAESRAAERALDEVHEALEALLLTPLLPPLLTPAGGAPLRAPMPEEGGDASPRASLTEKFDDVARRLQICVQLLAERCAQELELATVLYLCWEGAARQAALSRSWRCECHACVALCAGLRGAACAGSVPGRDCFPKQLHGPIGTAAVNTALLASPGGSAARRGPEEQARWHLWQPPYTLLNITLTDPRRQAEKPAAPDYEFVALPGVFTVSSVHARAPCWSPGCVGCAATACINQACTLTPNAARGSGLGRRGRGAAAVGAGRRRLGAATPGAGSSDPWPAASLGSQPTSL